MQIKSLKKSRQREAVYDFLMTRKDHPTADFIYENVRKTFPNISLGTVYRNLNLLVELGQAQRFSTYDGYDHFDGNPAPHYHLSATNADAFSTLTLRRMTVLKLLLLHALAEK